MARLNIQADSDGGEDTEMYTSGYGTGSRDQEFSSPRHGSESFRSRSSSPFSDQENPSGLNGNGKRVRFSESDMKLSSMKQLSQSAKLQHGRLLQSQVQEVGDPDQDQADRRKIRKVYREITRDVNDNKTEYVKNSKALIKIFNDANKAFTNVKQTADATLDSRLLVTAADLAQKRAEQLTLGVKGSCLDINDFITKSMRFLEKSEEHKNLEGAFDWTFFGQEATSICCSRPPLQDFMMGPLAVQKKQRVIKPRRQRQVRNMNDMVKPQELKAEDLAKNENSTMKNTQLLAQILEDYLVENSLEKVLYFKFIVNPKSFGQTVENMFYTAFLVRDGRLAIEEDDNGLPYIFPCEPAAPEDVKEHHIVRKQIVFSMEKKTWRDIVKVFNITEPIIPTRARETQAIGQSGWYA